MTERLKQYFPLIRTRQEVLGEIWKRQELVEIFESWRGEQQEAFLDFCSGVRGIKLTYDSFFKEILSPETVPERLGDFLTQLLGHPVTIVQVLPNDSVRLGEETTLIVTDVIVEAEDGTLIDVEIQKIGYLFPGQRSACYTADMLLRQYKRVRDQKKEMFSYRDIKDVYAIVLFEKSTKEFQAYPNVYVHRFGMKSDTGLKLNLLMNFYYIPLDIFKRNLHNKGIRNKLDAWLAFLCEDDPEVIIQVIERYPEFKAMYEHVYDMCRNVDEVMRMYSEELRELDRNTVKYMIDQMQEEIEQKEKLLAEKDAALIEGREEFRKVLAEKDAALLESREELDKKNAKLTEKDAEIESLKRKLEKG